MSRLVRSCACRVECRVSRVALSRTHTVGSWSVVTSVSWRGPRSPHCSVARASVARGGGAWRQSVCRGIRYTVRYGLTYRYCVLYVRGCCRRRVVSHRDGDYGEKCGVVGRMQLAGRMRRCSTNHTVQYVIQYEYGLTIDERNICRYTPLAHNGYGAIFTACACHGE